MNSAYDNENDSERQRLFKLAARLTAEDFSRAMPNGWTIGTKLAHLAFWDMYYLTCVEGWERTGFAPFRPNVDAINAAVRELSRAIPKEAIDRKVETLPPELASAIEAGGYTRVLHRANISTRLKWNWTPFEVTICPPESGPLTYLTHETAPVVVGAVYDRPRSLTVNGLGGHRPPLQLCL